MRYIPVIISLFLIGLAQPVYADAGAGGGNGREKLYDAVRYGQIADIRVLLAKGVDIDVKDDSGWTALMFAVHYGQKDVVRFLIDHGADFNAKDKDGANALISARNKGYDEIVHLLEKAGEKPAKLNRVQPPKDLQGINSGINGTDNTGNAGAILTNNKGRIKIRGGRKSDRQNGRKNWDTSVDINSDLMVMAKKSNIFYNQVISAKTTNEEIDKRLLDPALIEVARKGDTAAVEDLLANGADVKVREKKLGETALIAAAKNGHSETVELLLANGALINEKDVFGWTSLMAAAENGHIATVKTLLSKGAGLKTKNEFGSTAFKLAAKNRHKKIARLIKKAIKYKSKKRRPLKSNSANVTLAHKIQPPLTPGARWAVIVGISDYKDSRIPSLRYASNDAQAFYSWAVSPDGGKYSPARVKLLIDEDATTKNIKDSLSVWLQQAVKEDMVTIFFAGHGSAESPDLPENLFLLSYDTQYDHIATTGFPMWYIEDVLKSSIKAGRILFFADASRSVGVGQSFELARRDGRDITINPISSALQNLSKIGEGICIISASNDKQISRESEEWGGGHGVFTYFLLKGLYGEADYNQDSRINLSELVSFLSENVKTETKNKQVPIVTGMFDHTLSVEK